MQKFIDYITNPLPGCGWRNGLILATIAGGLTFFLVSSGVSAGSNTAGVYGPVIPKECQGFERLDDTLACLARINWPASRQ